MSTFPPHAAVSGAPTPTTSGIAVASTLRRRLLAEAGAARQRRAPRTPNPAVSRTCAHARRFVLTVAASTKSDAFLSLVRWECRTNARPKVTGVAKRPSARRACEYVRARCPTHADSRDDSSPRTAVCDAPTPCVRQGAAVPDPFSSVEGCEPAQLGPLSARSSAPSSSALQRTESAAPGIELGDP
jgi:hypothetical protein